jgi:hypothetical protein
MPITSFLDAAYPPHERPDVYLIVAAHNDRESKIWSTENNVVIEHAAYTAVGAGTMYANILLDRYYHPMNAVEAMFLAVYVAFHVKECVEGCGKDTDVIAFQKGTIKIINRRKIKDLEDEFRKYSVAESELLRSIFFEPKSKKKVPLKSATLHFARLRSAFEKRIAD